MSQHPGILAPAIGHSPIFPPALVPVLVRLLPDHPVVESLGFDGLSDVLTRVFFASLQTEEREHHPIRVALAGANALEEGLDPVTQGWKQLRLRTPCPFTTRNLLRLSRAAPSDRLFITVARTERDGIAITGLAREGFGAVEGTIVRLRAHEPGNLEVWASGRRVLEYLQGYIMAPPEDVLFSSGIVRARLLAFATQASAPARYVEAIASIVRHLADHPHGGILVLSTDPEPRLPEGATFALRTDTHLWEVLHQLGATELETPQVGDDRGALYRAVLRTEIERTISEIGRLTALDGATILDSRLGVHGFGIILPVAARLTVLEVMDAAGTLRRAFPLDQYGARHRAAASYAAAHPGSLVFVASTTGALGCMLSEEAHAPVMLWRFRSGDLASPAP